MNSAWLPHTILGTASLLAPADRRAEWVEEWQSELWYIPARDATRFCWGAFRDALWLRRNNTGAAKQTKIHLESPLSCLGFLATLAAVSISIALCLPAPDTAAPHLRVADLPGLFATLLFLLCLLSPALLAMGWAPANRYPTPWRGRLRRAIFLALKIALMQPIVLIVLMVPFTSPGFVVACVLALRWVFADQRRRCPVCLRLLTNPIRIGTPSRTFLEWYGGESMCSRGHGMLQVPEIPASYSGEQWLNLDGSWSGLFTGASRPAARSGR